MLAFKISRLFFCLYDLKWLPIFNSSLLMKWSVVRKCSFSPVKDVTLGRYSPMAWYLAHMIVADNLNFSVGGFSRCSKKTQFKTVKAMSVAPHVGGKSWNCPRSLSLYWCSLSVFFFFFFSFYPSPIQVKRPVTLHEGHWDLSIYSWDSQGLKMTVTVRILYQRHHHENHHQNVEHHHGDHKYQQHLSEVGSEVGLDTL